MHYIVLVVVVIYLLACIVAVNLALVALCSVLAEEKVGPVLDKLRYLQQEKNMAKVRPNDKGLIRLCTVCIEFPCKCGNKPSVDYSIDLTDLTI